MGPPAPSDAADDAHLLRGFLADRHTPCPICGYDLISLPSDRCPECSAGLHLTVASDRVSVGAWFLAVVSWSLALGFDGVVTILLIGGLIASPPTSPFEVKLATMVGSVFGLLDLACGLGLWWIFARRHRTWNRWPRRTQWLVAWGMFGAIGLVHAAWGGFLLARL